MQYFYLWRTEWFAVLPIQANSPCQYPKVSGAILLFTILLHLNINHQAFVVWCTYRFFKSNHQGELHRLLQTHELNNFTEVLIVSVVLPSR